MCYKHFIRISFFIKNRRTTLKNPIHSNPVFGFKIQGYKVVLPPNNRNEIFLSSWCKSNELQMKILTAFRFKVTGSYENWHTKKALLTFQTSVSWKQCEIFPKFIILPIVLGRQKRKHMRFLHEAFIIY